MLTAIIGVGTIGNAVATDLVSGGEDVILAAHTQAKAEKLADELGTHASAASVEVAIAKADTVIFAVWLDAMKGLVQQYASKLQGKVVIDPSNPISVGDGGQYSRTLPDDVSAVSQIAALLPASADVVKAFGTLAGTDLKAAANRSPEHAVLFYATDSTRGDEIADRLIRAAGFDPVNIGGLDQALRIEMFGDLHQAGGLNGKLLTHDEALAAMAGSPA